MRRKRFQRGCVRKVKHGRRWVWIGKYYEEGTSRTKVLGQCAEMTEGAALAKLQEFLRPLNETAGMRQGLPSNFEAYVSNVYLPQRRKKWKDSTDLTTTDRIRKHLLNAFGEFDLKDLSRDKLQRLLDQKTEAGLSRSMVSHLRWDLNAIFKMANDDNLVKGNPAGSLVTPKGAKSAEKRTMTKEQVLLALSALDIRERIVFLLAVLVGLRPGEIFALRWSKVDERMVEIAQRVYRGLLMTQSRRAESDRLPYHRTWLVTLNAGGKSARHLPKRSCFRFRKGNISFQRQFPTPEPARKVGIGRVRLGEFPDFAENPSEPRP